MTTPHPTSDAVPPTRTERRCLIALLVLAALLRLGIIVWKSDRPAVRTVGGQVVPSSSNGTDAERALGVFAVRDGWQRGSLAEDRDLYWGIAAHLVSGEGYVHPDLGHATAYRPPLYPLLLAAILWMGGGVKMLAVVQISLGVATAWLTWRLSCKLEMSRTASLATAFVALNPLLIQSTALAMTETLCAFLLVALMDRIVGVFHQERHSAWMSGMLLGLAMLCRPTVWAFVVLAILVSAALLVLPKFTLARHSLTVARFKWLVIVVVCALTVSPWAIRNQLTFHKPILTTTHGGYTLLLGNNDAAFRDEIANATGVSWESGSWQVELERELMLRQGLVPSDEIGRDSSMSRLAIEWITQHPGKFWDLCWLRVRRFWNLFPGGMDAGSLPLVIRWGMAVFFGLELSAAAVGLWRLRRDEWVVWWPLVLLVLSFALVHVVYWSNLRMRAPVEPVLALLAARGLSKSRSAFPG